MSDQHKEEIIMLARQVRIDPQNNAAWLNLGNALGTISIQDEDGNVFDGQQCYVRCLENDNYYWRAWYNLGMTMKNHSKVNVRDTDYSRQACLVQCLEMEDSKNTANAWLQLGVLLFDGTRGELTTTIGEDEKVNDRACFTRALELDPTLSEAWHNLGLISKDGMAKVNDADLTPQQCIVNALEANPNNGRAWYSLAVDLCAARHQGDPSTKLREATVSGQNVDELQCVIRALENDRKLAHGWCLLSNILRQSGTKVGLVGGQSYNEKEALLMALSCDRQCALAWCNLAPVLGPRDNITIEGQECNAQDASLRALELYDRIPQAWYNLGASLVHKEGDDAVVNSPSHADEGLAPLNAKSCFVRALTCEPHYGRAWYSLGTCMNPTESITVNGQNYNKYDCVAKGEHYGGLWDTPAAAPAITESAHEIPEPVPEHNPPMDIITTLKNEAASIMEVEL